MTEVNAADVTTANPSGWAHTNIYAGGKQIGTYDSAGLHLYVDDPLGTRRAQVLDSAGTLEATYQSLPFGDGLNAIPYMTGAEDPTENHFTGKERDPESGNDYMFARYYNSATGRFLSPDWSAKEEPVPYAKLEYPQTLNLYAYVLNNPVTLSDPDGHKCGDAGQPPCASSGKATTPTSPQAGHPVVIRDGKAYEGKLCGDHECVAYVKEAGGFNNPTTQWKAGPKALDYKDKGLATGTAIMLADKDGNYPKGSSPKHAAEFVRFTDKGGIEVRDQWAARFDKKTGEQTRPDQPVHTRILEDHGGKGNPISDASQYHILLIPTAH